MEYLSTIWNIALIIAGFGALIFIHELGHFLAARWAGIRCESFAIGMGPVVLAYRPGVGVTLGSSNARCTAKYGKPGLQMSDDELRANGVGETEYSLRALPLGGFVGMLGQDDLRPGETSVSTRGFQRAPIWKRMIVISAGVTANVACAIVLFVVAFMYGVRFDAPMVGGVSPDSSAGTAVAVNAAAAGVTQPGLRAGDTVQSIDDRPTMTFQDIMIAAAMGRSGQAQNIVVTRPGVSEPLEFQIVPTYEKTAGMQIFGVAPAFTATLIVPSKREEVVFGLELERGGLSAKLVPPGSALSSVNGTEVTRLDEAQRAAKESGGKPLATVWTTPDGSTQEVSLAPQPAFQVLYEPLREKGNAKTRAWHLGLLGAVPLLSVDVLTDGSPNEGVLKPGDAFLRAAEAIAPSLDELREQLAAHAGKGIPLLLLRKGEEVKVTAQVAADATLGFRPGTATDVAVIGKPIDELGPPPDSKEANRASALAALDLLPLTRFTSVAGEPVADWAGLRKAFQKATAEGARSGKPTTVQLTWRLPTPGREEGKGSIEVSAQDAVALQELSWVFPITPALFEPQQVILQADGNPLTAIGMGFRQTGKMIQTTYLTLDRLFRGSVSVEQLRGPVGIVHMGTHVVDRGAMWFIFFLAAISVNLAVLNFLPLPIVDGGLFLYLVYERLTGKPPSIAFQNVALIAGLCLLGGIFLITFYNDVMRLVGT